MRTILILMPYFGRWPEWFPLFLASCRTNPTVDWLFFTDCPVPDKAPANVRFVSVAWPDCKRLISRRLGLSLFATAPYKLCDLRFAYGDIFAEYAAGYDFVGFGDIDVIYGDLRKFLSTSVLEYDLITHNERHVSGHLTLLRNVSSITQRYRECQDWKRGACDARHLGLDENCGYYGIERVHAEETFNTPLSPYVSWRDGTFQFPAVWYWKEGRLTNNLDGDEVEFMYLHFMRYKFEWQRAGRRSVVHFDMERAKSGWKLCRDGFYRCDETEGLEGVGVISVQPALVSA